MHDFISIFNTETSIAIHFVLQDILFAIKVYRMCVSERS